MPCIRHLFLILLLSVLPASVLAQLPTGSWRYYPAMGEPTGIVETPHLVYYTSEGCLFSYDKDNDETRAYYPGDDISRGRVDKIYYNPDRRYLAVIFKDGNIDLLYDDGRRVAMPDIRDANLTVSSRAINDVCFDGNLIYVATSFGLVIFREDTAEVRETGIYNENISAVNVTSTHFYIVPSSGDGAGNVLVAAKGQRINRMDLFAYGGWISPLRASSLLHGTDNQFISIANDGNVYFYTLDSAGKLTKTAGRLDGKASQLIPTDKGVYVVAGANLYFTDTYDSLSRVCVLPAELGSQFATRVGPTSIWAGNALGVGNYRIADDGTVTVLRDKFMPDYVTSFADVSQFNPATSGRGLFLSNLGFTRDRPAKDGVELMYEDAHVNLWRDGAIRKYTFTGPFSYATRVFSWSPVKPIESHLFAPMAVVEDPDDPEILYVATPYEGIYVIKNGTEYGKYDVNSKIVQANDWAYSVNTLEIDSDGNLIVGVASTQKQGPQIVILPADKRRKLPSEVTADDWVALDMGTLVEGSEMTTVVCRHSPFVMVHDDGYGRGMTILYTNGTLTNPSDDRYVNLTAFIDQDGNQLGYGYITTMVEDKRGRVWVGCDNAIFEISNFANAFNTDDYRITRLKIPRNDGTNLADYLLDGEKINHIAVDGSDRKWVATENSGLYLVSENGDEVIANYNTSNSPLTTNRITQVWADPNSNSVLVGTLDGLYEFSSDSTPPAADYSDVLAYPNPVTPDYTGLITIRGLMDSSLVKIMDSGMNLVAQTHSEGGTALWDGCYANGSRVRTGVYYVLASTSGDTSSKGDVVAKILVVN